MHALTTLRPPTRRLALPAVLLALAALAGPRPAQAAPLNPANFTSLGPNPFTQAGTYTVDTAASPPTITAPDGGTVVATGVLVPTNTVGSAVDRSEAVFCFDSIDIPASTAVVGDQNAGSHPLALLSKSTVTVEGGLGVSGAGGGANNGTNGGNGGNAGPGGGGGSAAAYAAFLGGGTNGAGGAGAANGGSGAGNHGTGGDGGSVEAGGGGAGDLVGGGAAGGNGGSTYDSGGGTAYGGVNGDLALKLEGGSGGGGEYNGSRGGAGGAGGGGAVEVDAEGAVTLAAAAQVRADGGGSDYAGAGAGGGILLSAGGSLTLATGAAISTRGGNGSFSSGGGGGFVYLTAPTIYGALSATDVPAVNVSGGVSDAPGGAGVLTVVTNALYGPPTATPQSASVGFGVGSVLTLSGTDPAGEALTYAIASGPSHGSLQALVNGTYFYLPAIGYHGVDSFTFTATDTGGLVSAPAKVSIMVTVGTKTGLVSSLNPSAVGQSVTFTATVADTIPGGPVPAGTVTFSYVGPPAFPGGPPTFPVLGTTTLVGGQAQVTTPALPAGAQTVVAAYNPAAGFAASSTSLTQTVLSAPTANAQSVSVAFNTAKGITLTGSDPNSPAQSLTYSVATNPAHGTLSGFNAGTGAVTYTPSAGYSGLDSFTFTVSNGPGTSAPATVTLNVAAPVPATVTGVSASWGGKTASLGTGSNLLPAGRITDVPWLGIKSFTLTLSAPGTLAAGGVSVTGVTVANYGPVTVSGSGTSYTVTLAQPITGADRVTLSVGNAGVTSFTGTLPVLPGDVGDDGSVSSSDLVLDRNAFGTANAFGDINGDGAVNVTDYTLIRALIGTSLP